MVSRRNQLLKYLTREDRARYQQMIGRLGLQKVIPTEGHPRTDAPCFVPGPRLAQFIRLRRDQHATSPAATDAHTRTVEG